MQAAKLKQLKILEKNHPIIFRQWVNKGGLAKLKDQQKLGANKYAEALKG